MCRCVWALLLCACVGEIDGTGRGATSAPVDAPMATPAVDAAVAPVGCPGDMMPVDGACMDRFEAPNLAGAPPLVMYSFTEAEAWCQARGKRLCFDDEWTAACAGAAGWAEPYGPTRVPGACNDDKVWRVYNQTLLNGWPAGASGPDIASLAQLLDAARATGTAGAAAADHVGSLYQGTGGGEKTGCAGAAGVYDLVGNVEEWTRRRDGGMINYHGNLKGRYWAEARTCQSGVTTHADPFRFYEVGFRCCQDGT